VRFRDVCHQDRALSILRRALRSGRMPHAYLFEGPEGVGKELTARALAARLLCETENLAPDADACGDCRACRLLAGDNHPDYHLIHRGLHKLHPDRSIRASKGLFLGVDLIRHFLISPATIKPNLGRRHVFVIRDAERMNDEAQNALLKTLEEPPGQTCLILVSASAERLLPTIRSRCQRVPFDLLPVAFVEQRLTSQCSLSPSAAHALARLADGRLGAALRWHDIGLLDTLDTIADALDAVPAADPERFGRTLLDLATALATRAAPAAESNAAEDADTTEDADEDGGPPKTSGRAVPTDALRDALKLVLRLIASLYRDALVCHAAATAELHLPQQRARIERLARRAEPDVLESAVQTVVHAERLLDQNVAPQLACERLAAALSGAAPVL